MIKKVERRKNINERSKLYWRKKRSTSLSSFVSFMVYGQSDEVPDPPFSRV